MNYRDHLSEIKKIPITHHIEIKEYIKKIKEQEIVSKICAKWFSLLSKDIKFLDEPNPPIEWIEFKTAKEFRTDAYKHLWVLEKVQEFVKIKKTIELANYVNFSRIQIVIKDLDESEIFTIQELKNKSNLFLDGLINQKETVFPVYDFSKRKVFSNYENI